MALSPIVLFTYNRPVHTLKTLKSLSKNRLAGDSILFIYSDGPKDSSGEKEYAKVAEVRKIIRLKKWCREVTIIESKTNKGLANSIVAGVTEIVNRYGKVIVLEDDMVSSKFFLSFMNDALNRYETSEKAACISGYTLPVRNLPASFFIAGADCWGWGTWKRAWDMFEPDGRILLKSLQEKKLTDEFDFHSAFPFTRMLIDQVEGKNDSWAIRWYASAFLSGKFVLYPGQSFIHNIGNDASGFHQSDSDEYHTRVARRYSSLVEIPVKENREAKKLIENY